jgi:hypothetical protein
MITGLLRVLACMVMGAFVVVTTFAWSGITAWGLAAAVLTIGAGLGFCAWAPRRTWATYAISAILVTVVALVAVNLEATRLLAVSAANGHVYRDGTALSEWVMWYAFLAYSLGVLLVWLMRRLVPSQNAPSTGNTSSIGEVS